MLSCVVVVLSGCSWLLNKINEKNHCNSVALSCRKATQKQCDNCITEIVIRIDFWARFKKTPKETRKEKNPYVHCGATRLVMEYMLEMPSLFLSSHPQFRSLFPTTKKYINLFR